MANSSLQRAEGSNITIGNKQYQLVKGPTGQMRAVINKPKEFIKPQPTVMTKVYKIYQYILFLSIYKSLTILISITKYKILNR